MTPEPREKDEETLRLEAKEEEEDEETTAKEDAAETTAKGAQ